MNNQKRTNKVYISNLPDVNRHELKCMFEEYGEVVSENFNSASSSGKDRDYLGNTARGKRLCAIIEYRNQEQAEIARTSLHNRNFKNNKLIVDFYDKNEDSLGSNMGSSDQQFYSNFSSSNGIFLGSMNEKDTFNKRGSKFSQPLPMQTTSPSNYISQQPNGSKIEVKLITQDDGTQRKVIERRKKSSGLTPQKLNDIIKKIHPYGDDEKDQYSDRNSSRRDNGSRSLVFQKKDQDGGIVPSHYVTRKAQIEEIRKSQIQANTDVALKMSDKSQESLEEGEEDPNTLKNSKISCKGQEPPISRDFERPVSKNFFVSLDGLGNKNSDDIDGKKGYVEPVTTTKKGHRYKKREYNEEPSNNSLDGSRNPNKMFLIRTAIDDYYKKDDHVNYLKLMKEFNLWDVPEYVAKAEELRKRIPSSEFKVQPIHQPQPPQLMVAPTNYAPIIPQPNQSGGLFPNMRIPTPIAINPPPPNFAHQLDYPHIPQHGPPGHMVLPPNVLHQNVSSAHQQHSSSPKNKKKSMELSSEQLRDYHRKLHKFLKRKHESHIAEYENKKSLKRKSSKSSHENHDLYKGHLKHTQGSSVNNIQEQSSKKLKVDPTPPSNMIQPPHNIFPSHMLQMDYYYDPYNKMGIPTVLNHPPMMPHHFPQHGFFRGHPSHHHPEDFIPPPPSNVIGVPKWGIPFPSDSVPNYQPATTSSIHAPNLISVNYSTNNSAPSGPPALPMNNSTMPFNSIHQASAPTLIAPAGGGSSGPFLNQPVQSQFNYNIDGGEVYGSGVKRNIGGQYQDSEVADNSQVRIIVVEEKKDSINMVDSQRKEFSAVQAQQYQSQVLIMESPSPSENKIVFEEEEEETVVNNENKLAIIENKEIFKEAQHIKKIEGKGGPISSDYDMRTQNSLENLMPIEQEKLPEQKMETKEEELPPPSNLQIAASLSDSESLLLVKKSESTDYAQIKDPEDLLERNNSVNSVGEQQEDPGNSENSERLNKLLQNKKYKSLLNSIIRKGGKMPGIKGIKLKKEN